MNQCRTFCFFVPKTTRDPHLFLFCTFSFPKLRGKVLPSTVRGQKSIHRLHPASKQKGLLISPSPDSYPKQSVISPAASLKRRQRNQSNFSISLQNDESIFLSNRAKIAKSFSQGRLTKLVSQSTEVLFLRYHCGFLSHQRYQNPHQEQKWSCEASWKSRKICPSGSEWMLGKVCPLLRSLYADICNQDGKYP